MSEVTRRQAMALAASAGAVALTGAASQTKQSSKKRSNCNCEPAVESAATPEHYGPRELYAVVNEDGTLKRGFHAVSSTSLEQGVYEVIFNRDVRRGVYLVTPGGHGYTGVPLAAVASVMGRATDPRGVLVYTADMQGDPLAVGFHLLVVCPEGFA
jgi:hypothetical protein